MKHEEDDLQRQVEAYLKTQNLKYIHIPKQLQQYIWGKGRKSIPIHIAMIASLAFKGIPDLIIFGYGKTLIIELKAKKGTLTDEQKEWKKYGMEVCRDFESAKKLIDAMVLF